MAKRLQKGRAGPEEKGGHKAGRKRTPSIEIQLSRLQVLVDERPDDAEELVKKTKTKIERNSDSSIEDIELTPMTLVIAANAIVLERYNNDEVTPYEASVDENLKDNVETALRGLLVDMNWLLKNYKDEIIRLSTRSMEREEILKRIPGASQVFKKAIKKVLEVSSGIGLGALAMKIIYGLTHSHIGHWGAVGAGAVAGAGILFGLSWKGAEFLSKSLIYVNKLSTDLQKKMVSIYYSQKKAAKLKIDARALQSAMSEAYEKEYEMDYKVIENIGKTLPSPFDNKTRA